MCDPVTVLAIAAVTTAGAQVYGQYEQSKAQDAMYKINQRNALTAQRDAYEAQATQANQRRDAAGQASVQNALDAARARSSMAVAANDAGVSGLSIDALMNDITRQEATNASDLATNEAYGVEQRIRDGKGIQANTADRINSMQRGNFNPIIGGLQIASAGVQGYYQGKAIK